MDEANVGSVVTLRGRFWKSNGDPGDPAAVSVTFTNPSGSSTTLDYPADVDKADVGDYTYPLTVDDDGLWAYYFTGTGGDVTATTDVQFILVGAEAGTGPCEPWTTWDRVSACKASLASIDDGVLQDLAIEVASEILWNLTDRAYGGLCSTTRSLCMECGSCGRWLYWWSGDILDGPGGGCGCGPTERVDLGGSGAPVWAVTEVVVDGDVLSPSAYRLYDQRWLARIDDGHWPRLADLTDPSSFRATWVYGQPIPKAAQFAAAKFAAEIAAQCGGQACEIPQRVTSVTREGVNYTILDSMQIIQQGRTGIAMVDLFIAQHKQGIRDEPGMINPAGSGGVVKTTF